MRLGLSWPTALPIHMHPASRVAPGLTILALLAGRPATALAQGGATDTLRLSLAEVLTQVREEPPIWKAGSARVSAARARAAEQSSYHTPSVHIATARLTESRLELLQPLRWPWEGSAL